LGSSSEISLVGAVNLMCRDLVIAGNETTVFLLANVVMALTSEPQLMQEVRRDPRLITSLVEESLRHDSPSQHLRRTSTKEVVLNGTVIPAGATLLLMWGSANRDGSSFDEPDRFDIHRASNGQHLAFGRGIHFCLGAYLARLEARIAVEELLSHFEVIELLVEKSDLRQIGYDNFCAPRSLHLECR
jgi:cytochrome P450